MQVAPGVETINFAEVNVKEELARLVPHGPDVAVRSAGIGDEWNPGESAQQELNHMVSHGPSIAVSFLRHTDQHSN